MDLIGFREVFNAFPEAIIIIDTGGQVQIANQAICRLLKRTSEEMESSCLPDLVEDSQRSPLLSRIKMWSMTRQGSPAKFTFLVQDEYTSLHCVGSLFMRSTSSTAALIMIKANRVQPKHGGFNALNKKIKELEKEVLDRRKYAKALVESEAQVRLLLDSTGDAIFGMDMENQCTFANKACIKLLGYTTTEELLGTDLFKLLLSRCSTDQTLRNDMQTALLKGKSLSLDSGFFANKQGICFPVQFSMNPMQQNGSLLGSVVTFQDLTEKQRVEAELYVLNTQLEERVTQRTEELNTSNVALQDSIGELRRMQSQLVESEKMAALGGLVAGVAHEINTPVGVGVTAVSHLERKIKQYKIKYTNGELTSDDFEALMESTEKACSLILNNLLRASSLISSFKKIAVDQTCDEPRNLNLLAYISEVISSLTPKLKQLNPEVAVICDPAIQLFTHPGALSQIITNFIMNSLIHGFDESHSFQGRGSLKENSSTGELSDGTCPRALIEISVEVESNQVVMQYRDNGKGIHKEKCSKVFDPFFTTKRDQGGSGLGMHIVYNLVTQTMGGLISLDSDVGEGVRFSITVPIKEGTSQST